MYVLELYAVNHVSNSASDQSPLTIVSSSSPEPTLETQAGHDDITSYKTWEKFLPDSETRAENRLSPEIPIICPTPVKGAYYSIVIYYSHSFVFL